MIALVAAPVPKSAEAVAARLHKLLYDDIARMDAAAERARIRAAARASGPPSPYQRGRRPSSNLPIQGQDNGVDWRKMDGMQAQKQYDQSTQRG
eukprot:PRCOL_00001471-RA